MALLRKEVDALNSLRVMRAGSNEGKNQENFQIGDSYIVVEAHESLSMSDSEDDPAYHEELDPVTSAEPHQDASFRAKCWGGPTI